MSPYRIIVTGSRDWPDSYAVERALTEAALEARNRAEEVTGARCGIVVVHGASGKADGAASYWADAHKDRGVTQEQHEAGWLFPPRKGDKAGPIRNEAMAAKGAHVALAFPLGDRRQSPGTWDCVDACARHGIPVRIFPRVRP